MIEEENAKYYKDLDRVIKKMIIYPKNQQKKNIGYF